MALISAPAKSSLKNPSSHQHQFVARLETFGPTRAMKCRSIALQKKRLIYGLLFRASATTLLEVARDPRHPGAEIGFFSVLHTWDQRLQHHPHVHCVIAAGGLAPDYGNVKLTFVSAFRALENPTRVGNSVHI